LCKKTALFFLYKLTASFFVASLGKQLLLGNEYEVKDFVVQIGLVMKEILLKMKEECIFLTDFY